MRDKRAWAPVDIGYLDNPKMLDVLDASSTATLMHLASILYCAQHLTDGHIAPGVARRKVGGTKDDDRLLIDSGLWHSPGHDCETCPEPDLGKVYVHNFLEHNRTAEKTKAVSERRSEAAKARWEKTEPDATRMQSALQDAQQDAMQNSSVCNAEREREIEIELLVNPDGSTTRKSIDNQFAEWWTHWPKKVKKQNARNVFPEALKTIPLDALIEKTTTWVEAFNATGSDRKFMPDPERWLKHQRWEDDLTTTQHQPTQNFDINSWKG